MINPTLGAHDMHIVDLDGDGKMDVLASGNRYPMADWKAGLNSRTAITPGSREHLTRLGDGIPWSRSTA